MAPRKALRRALVSLLAAILLVAISLAVFGWKRLPSVESEPALAQEPSPSGQAGSGGTAFMVLIDESGGMNGRCGDSGQVFVVDQEGKRYQIARFFYSLVFSYWETLPVNERPQEPLIGFIQYARQFTRTDIPPEGPPSGVDSCYTRYVDAIKVAINQLESMRQQGAHDLHIILITDGSFRGTQSRESDRGTETDHQNAQDDLGETFRNYLGDIKLHVLILGRSRCYEQNDCGLNSADYALRRDDIEWWRDTAPNIKPGQITVLDERHPFEAIAQIFWDWVSQTSFGTSNLPSTRRGRWDMSQDLVLEIPPAAEWAKVVLVSPNPLNEADILLYDENGRELDQPRLLQVHSKLPAQGLYWAIDLEPRRQSCTPRKWTLRLSCRGQSAHLCESFFYWWVDFPEPRVQSVEVPPRLHPPQFPNPYPLTITVALNTGASKESVDKIACYRWVLEAYGENPSSEPDNRGDALLLQRKIYDKLQSGEFSITLPITPFTCAPHSIRVVARIENVDESGNAYTIDEKTSLSEIAYQPEILWDQIRCECSGMREADSGPGCSCQPPSGYSVDSSSPITLEIPIRYATEVCNPGIQIRFKLVCNQPSCGGDKCLDPSQVQEWDPAQNINSNYIQSLPIITQGETASYQVVFTPSNPSNPGLWECGYQAISITQISKNGERIPLGNVDLREKCLPDTSRLDVTPILIFVFIGSRNLFFRLRKPALSADGCPLPYTEVLDGTKGSA